MRPISLAALLVMLALVLVYWFPLRRWFARWGATDLELSRIMKGDAFINPTHSATSAVTIDAPAENIWPWLVQIGYQRGGLYSYDWLDRLFGFLDRPSAARVVPEFQHLQVGDKIHLGREELTVEALEPDRTLVLRQKAHGYEWVWQWGLYPVDSHRTRLVSRSTERMPRTFPAWLFMRITEPAAFIMGRRMLLGLKERSEAQTPQAPASVG